MHWANYVLSLIAAVVVGAILWALFRNKGGTPLARAAQELKAIGAERHARLIEANQGRDDALKHVEETYSDELAKLKDANREKAAKLRDNPAALARFLLRASGRPSGASN